jgi:GWxTD domain-containing protein
MMTHRGIFLAACGLLLAAMPQAAEKAPAVWKTWLEEVKPIMTRAEWDTFKDLATEEDRLRFREAFWRVRDPDPETPVNEFQEEHSRRVAEVRAKFGGPHTDRGRLYLLLGKPQSVSRYSGEQELVECELWSYSGLSQRGLPPFLNFLFYKPDDVGEFRQFYPGMQGARELILPGVKLNSALPQAAYQAVRQVSGELADASLSLIPGEGDPRLPGTSSTSALVMARVQGLPEKEVPSVYLRSFSTAAGSVKVSDSSRRIQGWGDIVAVSGSDFAFIHYAMLPDQIGFKKKTEQSFLADIVIYLTVEDANGRGIFNRETSRRLDVTAERKAEMDEKRVLFREFCPVVPGRYRVQATWINKANGDFFSVRRDVAVGPGEPALLTGFKLAPARSGFLSFAAGGRVVLSDPRFLYSRRDSLSGLVAGAAAPSARLVDKAGSQIATLALQPAGAALFSFEHPLQAIADDTHTLLVSDGGREIGRRTFFVMPDHVAIQRPFAFERSDGQASRPSYWAIEAEQYLNLGRPADALARLELIPPVVRTPAVLSLLAQACYQQRDYHRVLDVLEGMAGGRTFAELTLMANSAIELKLYEKAAGYLERLRQYGDSAAVNHLLAATWTMLGDAGKAGQYHRRALEIEKIDVK